MPGKLRKLYVRNFKSLGEVGLRLGDLTALVGPNGAGKSNVIDGLRFLSECLQSSVSLALHDRGGVDAVRQKRRRGGHPTHFEVRVEVDLEDSLADYSFTIGAKEKGGFFVSRENCLVFKKDLTKRAHFRIENGVFKIPVRGVVPKIGADRLALPLVSAKEEYRPLYDFLTSMKFYSIVPSKVKELQDPDPGQALSEDGSNAAAVLREIASEPSHERVCEFLSKVVPGIQRVEYRPIGPKGTIRFRQVVGLNGSKKDKEDALLFDAINMSDGTLRVLGILLAVYQPRTPTLIGIEEPESTLHPAAADVLVDILREGAKKTQIVITTHSPTILDHQHLREEDLRAVLMKGGRTIVAPVDPSSREAIRRRLYTPGDLLRMGELQPDESVAKKLSKQATLFAKEAK